MVRSSRPIPRFPFFVLLVALLLPMHAHAVLEALLGEKYPFKIVIDGNPSLTKSTTTTVSQQRKQSARFAELKLRRTAVRFDLEIIERWLHSQGYFDATISSQLKDKTTLYQVEPGTRYRIEKITYNYPPGVEGPPTDSLPIAENKPLKAEQVLATTEIINDHILEHQCLYVVNVNYDVEINRQTHRAFVTFSVSPSPSVVFDTPKITSLQSVKKSHLKHYFTFKKGDCFRRDQVELSRLALLQTNLFARIDVSMEPPHEGDLLGNDVGPKRPEVKVVFDVAERHHRTLKAGVGYDTNTRGGVSLGWEHRNLLHRAERLTVDSNLSTVKKNLVGELTVPHFRKQNQILTLRSDIERENTEAYENSEGKIGADLSRPLLKYLTGSLGTTLEYSRQLNLSDDEKSSNTLLSLPARIDYVNTNNPLNPTRGWALGLSSESFFSLENTGDRFVKSTLAASTYITKESMKTTPTLAVRLATGMISGALLEDVPVAHRFYVGGGGSVRGYAYQLVGDLSAEGLPQGGLSFSEISAEVRFRLNKSWGAVVFTDGGYTYADKQPSFSRDFLWGAGIGLRYFTSFAPIRFDIATPLTRRKDLSVDSNDPYFDDPIQLYINIGQSF